MAILWIAFEVRPEWRETGGAFRFMAPQELVRGLARSLGTLLHARPWADRYRVTSIVHLSDIWNTLWLVGAAALAVVVAVLSTSVGRKGLARPPVMAALLSLAGIVLLRALFRTPLGSLRDWDLFAGFGLGVAALAAGFSVTTPVRNLFVPITAAAIFFLVPWIGIQTSNSRAATRHFDAIDAEPRPEPPVAAYFHCVMGDRFANLRRYDLAQSAYRRALEAYPRYEFAWRLGTVRLVAKDFPGAITAFEKALELDPENLTTRVVLAEALMGAGQLERARDLLNEALAAGASVALAHLRLAQIDHRQGKSREATEHLALAEAALGPGDEAVRREMEDFRRGMAAAP
jgi:hypothetical protein